MLKIFDFRCQSCDHRFEAMVTSSEPQPSCPECESTDCKRLISAPRIDYTRTAANGTQSSDAMTTSIDRWQKGRAQKMKIEQRNLERHGTYD